jgi:hypothetical protein
MKRKFLAAAVALAPLLAAGAGRVEAATQITTATTQPVATATVNGGAPDDIDITSSGSVSPTSPGAAVTLDSDNVVTSEGSINFKDVSDATGILVEGGFTGQVTNTGGITLNESYVATDTNGDGVVDGPFAQGSNRIGIAVTGTDPFIGGITSTGPISIQGNTSEGISIQAPITGDLLMLTVTPPVTQGGTPTVANGSVTITGDNTVGVQVTPTGSIGGNVRITGVTARGVNAQGVVIDGAVGGTLNISGFVSASGYRNTVRPTNPAFSLLYTADELQQGGSAVSIGASIGKGLIVSAVPLPLSTTNPDQDGDGVPDALQGNGSVISYGAAPALQIGAAGKSVELGEVGAGDNAYGLVIQGFVSADGVYDPLITPNLPGVVSATAVQIGGTGDIAATLVGGLHNTGSIVANAYQADATAIHLGAGANVAALVNDGSITAASTQVNSATTPTGASPVIPAPVPVNVAGILIDPGATVTSISNSRGIAALISGEGGVGGTAAGILDRSGSVTSVTNTGNISASLNQTFVSIPMPGTLIGIDLSAGTSAQTITQALAPGVAGAPPYVPTSTYAVGGTAVENGIAFVAVAPVAAGQDPANNPALWKELGTTNPTIAGSIFFGSGGGTLTVNGGTVSGDVIDLGAGVNTLTVDGAPPSVIADVVTPGTVVTGALKDEGNYTLTVNVRSGTLSDTNPNIITARSVNVGANGTLLVSADPAHGTNTKFVTTGASTFETGAQVGLTLQSVQSAPTQTYTIVQTVPGQGTISAGTFGSGQLANAPFLYTASAAFVPAGDPNVDSSEIQLTVARKTAAQLNFNAAEGGALDAVLAAIPQDANIQRVILAQTTEAGLKSVYDQLLPDQGQGMFEALDAAAQAVSSMTGTTPDAGVRVAGSSLWLQEVNQRVDRSGLDSLGSSTKLFGVVGGYERMGPAGGALGVTVAYFNGQEQDIAAAVGEHVVGSMVEGGLYYRRAAGPLTVSARGAVGYSWFSDDRRFLAPGAINIAQSNWGGLFVDAHAGASYERRLGRFYARPEVSVDYLSLHEGAHDETGGGDGFDLNVASRASTRFSGQAIMVFGRQWGQASWLRTEVRAGYREIFAGDIGDTVANFAGGSPFTLAADPDTGGWATVGFSLKGGTQYSYVALEGDADFRDGEQRYDLRVAGRSMF